MINFKAFGLVWISRFIMPLGLVLLVVVYILALRPTISVYQKYNQGCMEQNKGGMLSVSPGYTASRSQQIQLIYGHFTIDTLNWKNQLWNTASRLSRKYECNVTTYPVFSRELVGRLNLFRQKIGFSGSYFELIKLLDELERHKGLGKVSSLQFSRKPREVQLIMEIDFSGIQRTKKI